MGMTIEEKHELTLSFNSSEELWQVAKKYQDNVVGMVDYKFNKWEQENGDDKFNKWEQENGNDD